MEQKEALDKDMLERIATVLKVPVKAIENFDEQAAVNIISNTFNNTNGLINYNPTYIINPVEKWMEALEENKRLYEALLQSEREKIALLERLLQERP